MKPIISLATLMLLGSLASAQVTYRSIPAVTQPVAPYDSLENIPQMHVKSLYGQQILVLGKGAFHPAINSFAPIDEARILKKQFEVVGAERNEKNRQVWLILASGIDTVYYQLTGASLESPSFVTIGYFEKQAKIYTGKKFKLRMPGEFKEINTGIIKQVSDKETFVCTGSSIIEEGKKLIPALTLESSNGDEIYTPIKGFEATTANSIQLFTIE